MFRYYKCNILIGGAFLIFELWYACVRYLKSTIGNITLIDRFRKKTEDSEASPEVQVFLFWMDYFVEATKTEVGDSIRFPVNIVTLYQYVIHL